MLRGSIEQANKNIRTMSCDEQLRTGWPLLRTAPESWNLRTAPESRNLSGTG
jgi:hypothetical protein